MKITSKQINDSFTIVEKSSQMLSLDETKLTNQELENFQITKIKTTG